VHFHSFPVGEVAQDLLEDVLEDVVEEALKEALKEGLEGALEDRRFSVASVTATLVPIDHRLTSQSVPALSASFRSSRKRRSCRRVMTVSRMTTALTIHSRIHGAYRDKPLGEVEAASPEISQGTVSTSMPEETETSRVTSLTSSMPSRIATWAPLLWSSCTKCLRRLGSSPPM